MYDQQAPGRSTLDAVWPTAVRQTRAAGKQGEFEKKFGVSPEDQYNRMSAPLQFQDEFDLSPYEQSKKTAAPMNINVADDPGYQFRMQQGMDAVEQSAAAKGGFFSGQAGKDLTDYSQGLASTEYQGAYNRELARRQLGNQAYQSAYGTSMNKELAERGLGQQAYQTGYDAFANDQNRLYNYATGMAGTGLQAAQVIGGYGSDYMNSTGAATQNQAAGYQNLGSAFGQGIQGAGQAYGQGIQQAGDIIARGVGGLGNYYYAQDLLNK